MAAAVSLEWARRRMIAEKKTCLAARKKHATNRPSVRLNRITCS
jgi:hypothetical protein